MSGHIDRLETVFHTAAELSSAEQRADYLDAACEGDSNLRRKVEALLKAMPVAEDMFQACEEGRSNQALAGPESAGSLVGPYKLLEIIGEGGMGVVYLAEQEKPIRRKVAIKIIKLGMDTRQVVARFEAERQALAIMDNPNIAQVLDGGVTGTGRPYFVMELVQGVPVTQFCETNHLSVEERLKLFIAVCQAIQSAHQKGIIHRDIKPTNVLVTMHNGAPHPMVIDFGVAKATGEKLTEKTLFTNFATIIGTPAYMSPEQAEMSKLDVDTRSDIYSLGVLLYELLTGTTPFPEERLRSVAYAEMQRILTEEEPERPSTRLRKKSAGSERPAVPRTTSLASDLDWIVMKCLEKDRSRRYETTNALAADIQAYLNDEPVVARPPSTAYRLQKFVRRNKLEFTAATFALIVLVLAVIVSHWQSVKARRAEQSAREQAKNAEFIKDFLVRQVLAVNPYVEPEPNPERHALVERIARAVDTEFADRPLIEAEMRMALSAAFAGLGDRRQMAVQSEKAYAIRQKLLGPLHSETLWSLCGMAESYFDLGRRREIEPLLTNTLALIRASPHEWSSGEAEVLDNYAWYLWRERPAAEVLPLFQEAAAMAVRTMDAKNFRLQNKLVNLAYVTKEAGRWQEAEALYAQGIRQCELAHGPEHPLTAQFLKFQADLFVAQGRWQEALTNLEHVVPIYHRALGTNHSNGLDAEALLARVYEHQGRLEAAAILNKSLYPRWAKYFPGTGPRNHSRRIAEFFMKHGPYDDAKAVFELLRESWEANPPENSGQMERFIEATAAAKGWPAAAEVCQKNFDRFGDSLWIWLNKAWVFRYTGDDDRYRRVVEKVLALPANVASTNDQHVPIEVAALGSYKFSPDQVKQLDSMMGTLETALPGRSDERQFRGYRAVGQMQFQLGRFDKCLAALENAESRQANPDPYLLFVKATCMHRLGRAEEARVLFDQGAAIVKPLLTDAARQSEGFLPTWQIYQQLLMHREAQALLGLP